MVWRPEMQGTLIKWHPYGDVVAYHAIRTKFPYGLLMISVWLIPVEAYSRRANPLQWFYRLWEQTADHFIARCPLCFYMCHVMGIFPLSVQLSRRGGDHAVSVKIPVAHVRDARPDHCGQNAVQWDHARVNCRWQGFCLRMAAIQQNDIPVFHRQCYMQKQK